MSSATAAVAERTGALSHRQVLTILTGLLLGMFLAAPSSRRRSGVSVTT